MYVKKHDRYLKSNAYKMNVHTIQTLEDYIADSVIYPNISEFLRSALRNYMIEYLTQIKKYDPKNWRLVKDGK